MDEQTDEMMKTGGGCRSDDIFDITENGPATAAERKTRSGADSQQESGENREEFRHCGMCVSNAALPGGNFRRRGILIRRCGPYTQDCGPLSAFRSGGQTLESPALQNRLPADELNVCLMQDFEDDTELVDRVLHGDDAAFAELFGAYRSRLWRLVNFRLDPRMQGRVDPDDVLQEAWLRAVDRRDHFLSEAGQSPFVWFRMIVMQTLVDLHRRHVGTQKRGAGRERSIDVKQGGLSTSFSIAMRLAGNLTSPSNAALRAERASQLDAALQSMNEIDREVLALRHFEELSNVETALVLGCSEQAASVRYVRAIRRLKEILKSIPGFAEQRTGI